MWKIKQLGGGREFLMRAHFGLPSVKNGEQVVSACTARVRVRFAALRKGLSL